MNLTRKNRLHLLPGLQPRHDIVEGVENHVQVLAVVLDNQAEE